MAHRSPPLTFIDQAENRDIIIKFRVNKDEEYELSRLALRQRRTISGFMRNLISEYLAQHPWTLLAKTPDAKSKRKKT